MATQETRIVDDVCVVALAGEIDMSTADDVEQWLTEAIRDTAVRDTTVRRLHADLSSVEFLDSSGLRALLRSKEAATGAQVDFAVTNFSSRIERVLRTVGLYDYLTSEAA